MFNIFTGLNSVLESLNSFRVQVYGSILLNIGGEGEEKNGKSCFSL